MVEKIEKFDIKMSEIGFHIESEWKNLFYDNYIDQFFKNNYRCRFYDSKKWGVCIFSLPTIIYWRMNTFSISLSKTNESIYTKGIYWNGSYARMCRDRYRENKLLVASFDERKEVPKH